jgi:arylsulfatase A-like enzyme/Tfp pilus assembly protein PilF
MSRRAKKRASNNKRKIAARERAPKQPAPKPSRGGSRFVRAAAILAIGAGVGLLVYFLIFRPGKKGVELPGGPTDNILLITLDTTRADRLGSYGYAKARTPRLDGLVREGIRFARVYSPSPLTAPSHSSIMSGLYPVAHGVRNNGRGLRPGIKTLAEILTGHGYTTAAFVSAFSVDSRFGLDKGFGVYDDTFQSAMPLKSENAERRAEATFARFSRWLDDNWQKKFLAWVHYYDPHLPYDPPPPYKVGSRGRDDLYDGEIAYMDHYVGAILDRLKEKGILEKTLVVVAGDHGEGLGDKVETGHGVFIYEETLRVPLIFSNSRIFPRPRVVESTVRLIDVAPTILEITGLGGEAAGMQGQSLIDWIDGKTGEDLDSLVETFFPRDNFGWSELVGLVAGPWKMIQAPRPELYNLESDPGERQNVFESSAQKARELSAKLGQEILRLSSGDGAAGDDAPAKAEDLERLRSLGYVNFAPAKPGSSFPDPKDKIGTLRLIQAAQAFEIEERYFEAEQVYRKILEDVPDSPAAYVNLAIAEARQKKFDQAIATLDTGLRRIPDSEILLVRLGHTYLVTEKAAESLATMEKVLALNPQSVDALTVCAGILDAAGKKDEARCTYERALAVEPESRHLRTSYAANLGSVGRLREAIKVYESLIADFPEEQAYYQFAAIAFSYLGETGRAVPMFEKALAIRPTANGYFNLAVANEKSGNFQQAIKYFRLYLENPRGESEANVRKARAALESLEKR